MLEPLKFLIFLLPFQISDARHYSANRINGMFIENHDQKTVNYIKYGGDLAQAMVDVAKGFPLTEVAIVYDNHTDVALIEDLVKKLTKSDISVDLFNVTLVDNQFKYFAFLSYKFSNFLDLTSFYFCTHKLSEHLLLEIYEGNYIRRNLYYVFYWGRKSINRFFRRSIRAVVKTVIVTNPRNDTYRLYYNQAVSNRKHDLKMVNWWNSASGLFHHPSLPSQKSVFQNFHGKTFLVPVLHKPPWHFVEYENDTFQRVLGGRDDRLLSLLASKLNFRYVYVDPPERSQGSSLLANGSFEGVLGLIGKRQYEFFLGDVTLTLERMSAVEFSFLTLADSVAFVTHAPSKLNEALALVRPFHWQVWPAIVGTLIVSGPFLYALVALPNSWYERIRIRSHIRLFFDCCWFTVTLFLKQTGKTPSSSNKCRFFVMILSISATYIIADMYSANLTSLLAKPGRERAITNLVELEQAMITRGYRVFVEKHSSSYSLLENGTGIYGRLWNMMTRKQSSYVIDSVEDGVQMVRHATDVAVIAGRETLFFDIQRFGAKNFHLSEKLNTAYSAIAFQIGCPYIENYNKLLISIFEAGILTKMTENEYEKLGKQQAVVNSDTKDVLVPAGKKETRKAAKAVEDNEKLQPINIKMLQGAFYFLFIGHGISGIVLTFEIGIVKQRQKCRFLKNIVRKSCRRLRRRIMFYFRKIRRQIRRYLTNMLQEAVLETFEYLE